MNRIRSRFRARSPKQSRVNAMIHKLHGNINIWYCHSFGKPKMYADYYNNFMLNNLHILRLTTEEFLRSGITDLVTQHRRPKSTEVVLNSNFTVAEPTNTNLCITSIFE